MPNWKNASDYKFTEKLTRAGWCWEFMRRNPKYSKQYADMQSNTTLVFDPPKTEGETDQEYFYRTLNHESEPRRRSLSEYNAMIWCMKPPFQDPSIDEVPNFLLPFPRYLESDQIGAYYHREKNVGPVSVRNPYAVLVFQLDSQLPPQIEQAKDFLDGIALEGERTRRFNIQGEEWPLYLRVFDARAVQAETPEIIACINAYRGIDNTVSRGYAADDRVSDHYAAAKKLVKDPLLILIEPPHTLPSQ